MDIRKWLAETEHPVPPEQPAIEHFLIPKQPDSVPDARRRRRRRQKRSSTDSSLLKVPSSQPRRKGVPAIERDRRDARGAVDRAYSDVSHSTRSESASDSTAAEHYARQPRRKTRPDCYGAGTKKRKEQEGESHPSRKSESRKSKRKSRRKKTEKTHSGIGQEFHAKNISKERLTLKPLEKMGLFSKGRTSTSVKGRGLPDLVFSEMRFLRNGHGESEHSTQDPDVRKKRKKDHAWTKEEDISAFFTSTRPALADVDGNKLAKGGRQTTDTPAAKTGRRKRERERERERSTVLDTAVPMIEPEGKASSLGFASKGLHHESTSNFSWSESVRAPSRTPGRRRSTSAVNGKRPDPSNHEPKEVPRSRHAYIRRQDVSSVVRQPIGAAMGRSRMSSVAPLQSRLTRSQSLPQRSSSPRRPDLLDGALNHHLTKNVTSPSSMPPVLQACGNVESQEHAFRDGSRSVRSIATCYADEHAVSAIEKVPEDPAREMDPPQSSQGSSGLGAVLQYCNYTSQAERRRTVPRRSQNAGMRIAPQAHDTGRRGWYRGNTQTPTVQFLAPDTQASQRLDLFGHGLYAQQEQRQQLAVHLDAEEGYEPQYPNMVDQRYTGKIGLPIQEDLESLSEQPGSYGLMEGFEDDNIAHAGLDCAVDDVEQLQEPAHTSVVAPGFWRPNKLY